MSASRVTPPWPCSTCGAPGVKNLGTQGHCATHISDFYRRLSPSVWELGGIGVLAGAQRPDHGPEFAELECVACGASWVGPLFDPCPWCERALAAMQEAQARRVLQAPDVDPEDVARWKGAMRAWRNRLRVAVDAELITHEQADRVWRREVKPRERAA